MKILIRPESEQDVAAIREVNRLAFEGPSEATLVDELRADGDVVVSLVAVVDEQVVGHILFSRLTINAPPGPAEQAQVEAVSLAPMAVTSHWQRRGVGSRLVEEGLQACRDQGERIAAVLGHADFYPRFGFSAQLAAPLRSPFGGGDAWMACELVEGALRDVSGDVEFAPAFARL